MDELLSYTMDRVVNVVVLVLLVSAILFTCSMHWLCASQNVCSTKSWC